MKRIILCIMLLLTSYLVSCNEFDMDEFNNIYNQLEIPSETSTGITLKNTIEGTNALITYQSSNQDVMNNYGYISVNKEPITITLKVTITIGIYSNSYNHNITVNKTEDVDFSSAQNYYLSNIPSVVDENINLIKDDYNGFEVKYFSYNEKIISSNGVIFKGIENQTTKFNITIINKDKIAKFITKEITVTKFSDTEVVLSINNYLDDVINKLQNDQIEDLPSTHESYGGKISWYSKTPGFVTSEGIVNKPVEYQNVEVSVYVEIDDIKFTKDYLLKHIGGNTDDEFIDKWLDNVIPTRIYGSTNYVDSAGNFKEQVRTNSYGAVSLYDGKDPNIKVDLVGTTDQSYIAKVSSGKMKDVSPPVLNAKFSEGYKMPNDEQILWVVIHESGIPYDGVDAKRLSDAMHNKMKSGTTSSWHYSVDEGSIYKHMPDYLTAWHAGDGMIEAGGNANGIGIEMCVNPDGNYECAMKNNARLVAYLLDKYNLTIDNVRRHYDFTLKNCPAYMINTMRYGEFLNMIGNELITRKYLTSAQVKWTIDDRYLEDQDGIGIVYNKDVDKITKTNLELTVKLNNKIYNKEYLITLYPN